MNKHNAFGHGNFSFNPVATYTKIIYLVPTLPQSVKLFVSYSAKLELQKQYNVWEKEMLVLNMLKSHKKHTQNEKLTTFHQERLPLTSCKDINC